MKYAQPGDPLVSNRGKLVAATDRGPQDFSLTVPNLANFQPKTRRSGKELPAEPQTQTVVNAIMVYTLLGMSENEMAVHLGTSISDIEHVKSLPAFQETFELVFGELLSANSNSLQARLASYAGAAVENVMELANYKPKPKIETDEETGEVIQQEGDWKVPPIVVLKANQDVLDRSGLHQDVLFGKHSTDEGNTLQIEIVSEQENRTSINIKTRR